MYTGIGIAFSTGTFTFSLRSANGSSKVFRESNLTALV